MLLAHQPSPHILLVEDNPDDIYFLKKFFEERGTTNHLHVVRDGLEAWHFLRRESPHEKAPRPSLILLDLKLPKLSGLELLERIKEDATLRPIPVVVLATSDDNEDALASYDLHATSFITKPQTVDEFTHVMERIEQFWLHLVKLPRG